MKVNRVQSVEKYLLPGAIVVFFVASLVAAAHRLPWSDEGWFSSASHNLAHHGFMGTTVLKDVNPKLLHIGERTYWVTPDAGIMEPWPCQKPIT